MAKINFPRKEIEKHIKLDDKTLERISLFGTTVESLTKDNLELEILANRPDLLSLPIFVNAFKSFEEKQTFKEYKAKNSNYLVKINKNVKNVRPLTACAVVKGLKFTDAGLIQIIQLQEKLHATIGRKRKKCAIGIYPLDKIKFPISFEARKPENIKFVPLGASKEADAIHILQKHPAGKEYADLLKHYNLYPIFIDADKKILSLPPIINSQDVGQVTTHTRDVFIECSGHDKKTLEAILSIIVVTLAEMGGTIYSVTVQDDQKEIYPKLHPKKHSIELKNINKILGFNITEKELPTLLAKMGHKYQKPHIVVQPWRIDILHEIDLIEDIAIAYGYDNIKPEIPLISTIASVDRKTYLRDKISEILAGLNYLEISNLHFITQVEAVKAKAQAIELENAKTEYSMLRPNLFIPLIRTLSQNTDSEYPQHLYEIGRVFTSDQSDTGVSEKEHLIIGLTPGNFTQAKQALDYLARSLNIPYNVTESLSPHLIDGRTGAIHVNSQVIGHLGEVHPLTLQDWKLKMPLSIIELDLEEIYNLLN